MSSSIVDVTIGLVVLFFLTAQLASGITEAISRRLNKRSQGLLRGLRALLEGDIPPGASTAVRRFFVPAPRVETSPTADPHVADLVRSPTIAPLTREGVVPEPAGGQADDDGRNAPGSAAPHRPANLPSYLSPRTFATGVFDLLFPDESPDRNRSRTVDDIAAAIDRLPSGHLRDALSSLLKEANGDLQRFASNIEHWYDSQMDRVTGWYKRWSRRILFFIGLALAATLNLDALGVAQSLYVNHDLRATIVANATNTTACPVDAGDSCIAASRAALSSTGLPIFWQASARCDAKCPSSGLPRWLVRQRLYDHGDWWGTALAWLLKVIGLLFTAWAVTLGAPFWFDVLGRLNSLRNSAPKPAKAT